MWFPISPVEVKGLLAWRYETWSLTGWGSTHAHSTVVWLSTVLHVSSHATNMFTLFYLCPWCQGGSIDPTMSRCSQINTHYVPSCTLKQVLQMKQLSCIYKGWCVNKVETLKQIIRVLWVGYVDWGLWIVNLCLFSQYWISVREESLAVICKGGLF